MSPRFSQGFAQLGKREDGLSAVEYAVMLAFLVIACFVTFILGGPGSGDPKKPSTFAIKLRDSSDRTVRVASAAKSGAWSPSGAERTSAKPRAKTGALDKSADLPAAVNSANNEAKAVASEPNMTPDDARKAILGLLKAHPSSFATSAQQVQNAPAVQGPGYVEIGRFRCHLQSKTFEYATLWTDGRSRGEIAGFFYQDANQKWTGDITRIARK